MGPYQRLVYFWAASRDDGRPCDTRDRQQLAIWHVNADRYLHLDYPTVRRMRETDDWSQFGIQGEVTRKEVLLASIDEWFKDLDAEFPPKA